MEKKIEKNSVDIYYNEEGSGDTTLLFVHGAFINKEYWEQQAEYFKDKYKIVAIDLPGHGKSGKNRGSWDMGAFGDDVAFLIKELKLKNVILIGHSMGGDIILEAASKCSDEVIGFVGVDNFKVAGTEIPEVVRNSFNKVAEDLRTNFPDASENFARNFLLSPQTEKSITERVAADYRNMDKTIGYDVIYSAFNYHLRERELMQNMHVKMNIISVDNMAISVEPLEMYCNKGFEVYHMAGTCHYPMLEDPAKFNQILDEIVTGIIG